MEIKLTLTDILDKKEYKERIETYGSIESFKEWWLTTIYHKIGEHEPKRVDKMLSRYERHSKKEHDYLMLNEIVKDVEFPEMYSPSNGNYYIFLPDAYNDAKYRLTVISEDGKMETHYPFETREEAIRKAAVKGCNELRVGAFDKLTELDGHKRSIVMYKAISQNIDLDTYLRRTKDIDDIKLYSSRVKLLKQLDREKKKDRNTPTP